MVAIRCAAIQDSDRTVGVSPHFSCVDYLIFRWARLMRTCAPVLRLGVPVIWAVRLTRRHPDAQVPLRLPDIGSNDRRVWATVLLSRADMGRRLPVLRCPGTGEFAGYPIAEFTWSTRSPNILIRLLKYVVR
jgi:hypothetical protein